jgi:hypothetical protein
MDLASSSYALRSLKYQIRVAISTVVTYKIEVERKRMPEY